MKTKTEKVREQTYGIASFLYYFYRINREKNQNATQILAYYFWMQIGTYLVVC